MGVLQFTATDYVAAETLPDDGTVSWQLNSISPSDQVVGSQSDLEWTFSYNGAGQTVIQEKIQRGDCIKLVLENPYARDAPDSYQSFDVSQAQVLRPTCEFKSGHVANCDIVDAQTFKITFVEDSENTLIEGRTTSLPFQNPYSARLIRQAKTTLLKGCSEEEPAKVDGKAKFQSFQTAKIDQDLVTIESSSKEIGVTDAELTVKFKPATVMKASGRISIQVPAWYDQTRFTDIPQKSADSMLDYYSEVTWVSHEGQGYTFDVQFQQASRSYTIIYAGPADIYEEIELRFSLFKNPVNPYLKKGFQISTMDFTGYLIDQSDDNLVLSPLMSVPVPLLTKEMYLQEEPGKNNGGRVGEYNAIQLVLDSQIPFEQYCYFTFEFPKVLQFDDSLTLLSGTGIFQPTQITNIITPDLYEVDYENNVITVNACRVPSSLTSQPIGSITFSFIKLPDYITSTPPIKVYSYSDNAREDIIISDDEGVSLNADMMTPGVFEQVLFKPSNFYAFSDNVSYTLHVRPQHEMRPDSRIIIDMPPTLIFDQDRGCQVALTSAKCELDASKNRITLTDIFDEVIEGGNILKFMIIQATNPSGARPAGPWAIRSESIFDGKYYAVDGQTSAESFYARSGTIESSMKYEDKLTFNSGRTFDLSTETEHNIPEEGFFIVTLPEAMAFDKEVYETQELNFTQEKNMFTFVNATEQSVIFQIKDGHQFTNNPITFSISGVRNPRSFTPSDGFQLSTMDSQGYIIDTGGQDLAVVMNEMNELERIKFVPMNSTNGAITTYEIYLDSFVHLEGGDILYVQFPPEVVLTESVSCGIGDTIYGLARAECSAVGQKLIAHVYDLNQKSGRFIFEVHGVKNPPSFRLSSHFDFIYMQTMANFPIQEIRNTDDIHVQTDTVARIWKYRQTQFSEKYNDESSYNIQFRPVNQITTNGIMILTWTDQVEVHEEAKCTVQTYMTFEQEDNVCQIDFDTKTIRVENAFIGKESYEGDIGIEVTRIRNPRTNKALIDLTIETFDDINKEFAIDVLKFVPELTCYYPCQTCAGSKDTCTSCWQDEDERFLMQSETEETCKTQCDDGWTRNGNESNICSRCAPQCATCEDNGFEGDSSKCTSCPPDHLYSFHDDPNACLIECPPGFFAAGDEKVCQPCSSSCYSCSGTADTCTACKFESAFPVLQVNECVSECRSDQTDVGGVCTQCESPCSTCSNSPSNCNSCDGSNGLIFTYGPTCVDSCPNGTQENKDLGTCEGCDTGCDTCDAVDQRICLGCSYGLLLHADECVNKCPEGYMANYAATYCISEDSLDLKLVYFPFLVSMAILFVLSVLGARQKKKHKLLTNFVIMMGMLEHIAIISQIIMTFFFGTWRYAIVIILIWILHVVAQPLFQHYFTKQIINEDKLYKKWRETPSNVFSRKFMNVLGAVVSWKFYKLLYSHFWGYSFKTSEFSQPHVFENLQKYAHLYNILTTYIPIVILNMVGLLDLSWGTQLYIMMIENLIIAIIMSILGVVEWFFMRRYLKEDSYKKLPGAKSSGMMNLMNVIEDSDFSENEIAAVKQQRLKDKLAFGTRPQPVFLEKKFEELLQMFGNRECKSACMEINSMKEEDPRRIRTYPGSPHLPPVKVDDPPKPLEDPYPDNCYNESVPAKNLKKLGTLGIDAHHKGIQCGGMFEDDMLRLDTGLVSSQANPWDTVNSQRSHKKKYRGRKNRYFRQIDNEDNDAGLILDSDEEGERANATAKENHLDRQAHLEAIKEVEEIREKKKQEAEKRRQANRDNEKVMSEENQKLKQQLEKQREQDARESAEFKRRIDKEERRRQEILMSADNNLKRIQDEKEKAKRLLEESEARKRAAYEAEQARALEKAKKEKSLFDQEQAKKSIQDSGRSSLIAKNGPASHKQADSVKSNRLSQNGKSEGSRGCKYRKSVDGHKAYSRRGSDVSQPDRNNSDANIMMNETLSQAEETQRMQSKEADLDDQKVVASTTDKNQEQVVYGGQYDVKSDHSRDVRDGRGGRDGRVESGGRDVRDSLVGRNAHEGRDGRQEEGLDAERRHGENDSEVNAIVSSRNIDRSQYASETNQLLNGVTALIDADALVDEADKRMFNQDLANNVDDLEQALVNDDKKAKTVNYSGAVSSTSAPNLHSSQATASAIHGQSTRKSQNFRTGGAVKRNSGEGHPQKRIVKIMGKSNSSYKARVPGDDSTKHDEEEEEDVDALFDELPDAQKRNFNEIDIVGDLDRDDRGNIVLPENKRYQQDFSGALCNEQGYLVDETTGSVLNINGTKFFDKSLLDERGNLPLPFSVEKFNFNPFELQGNLAFEDNTDPLSFARAYKSGKFVDSNGNLIQLQGFLQDSEGNLLDRHGRKRFDARQFEQFGGLMPKLYNYSGNQFEIHDVMGVFDRKANGKIDLIKAKDADGKEILVDTAGLRVNHKGYLINENGDICTRFGKIIFRAQSLKNGEFPKIFPFTRFNIKRILGNFEMDPGGVPILSTNTEGNFVDKEGRMVNQKGYFVDKDGNVTDASGNVMFERHLIDADGEIPEIFRMNLLRSDSQSSLSRLMDEIDKHQPYDEIPGADDTAVEQAARTNPGTRRQKKGRKNHRRDHSQSSIRSSNTEEGPGRYGLNNQRHSLVSAPEQVRNIARHTQSKKKLNAKWGVDDGDGHIAEEEFDEADNFGVDVDAKNKRKKKKKGKGDRWVEEVTGRDILMASAYGGVAKPRIRKANHRFQTVARERVGLQSSNAPKRPPKVGNLLPSSNNETIVQQAYVTSNGDKENEKWGAGAGPNAAQSESQNAEATTMRTGGATSKSRQHAAHNTTSNFGAQHSGGFVPAGDLTEKDAISPGANTIREKPHLKQRGLEASELKKKRLRSRKKSHGGEVKAKHAQPQYDKKFEDEFEKLYKKDIDKFIDGSDFEVESLGGFSELSKNTFKSAVQNSRMRGLEKVYLQRLDMNPFANESKGPVKHKKQQFRRVFQDRFCDDPKYVARGEALKFDIGAKTGSSSKRKVQNAVSSVNDLTAPASALGMSPEKTPATPQYKNISPGDRKFQPQPGQPMFRDLHHSSINYK